MLSPIARLTRSGNKQWEVELMHIFTYHQCPTQIGNWDETTGIIDCMHGSVVSWLTKTTDRSDQQSERVIYYKRRPISSGSMAQSVARLLNNISLLGRKRSAVRARVESFFCLFGHLFFFLWQRALSVSAAPGPVSAFVGSSDPPT